MCRGRTAANASPPPPRSHLQAEALRLLDELPSIIRVTDEPRPPTDPAAGSASSDEAAAFGLLEELGELEGLPSLLRVTHPAPSEVGLDRYFKF